MIVLAFDTSTDVGSLALLDDETVLAERTIVGRMNHAAQFFTQLAELLRGCGLRVNDIGLCAVGTGPGSFSGVRIGIAAAKGLRVAARKPLVGVSSSDALAQDALARRPSACQRIAVLRDARCEELYLSLYEVATDTVKMTGAHAIVAPDALPSRTRQPTFFVGPDNAVLRTRFLALPWESASSTRPAAATAAGDCDILGETAFFEVNPSYPRAAVVGRLALEKFRVKGSGDADVEPIYLRPPVRGIKSILDH